jgi:hypothetical protein
VGNTTYFVPCSRLWFGDLIMGTSVSGCFGQGTHGGVLCKSLPWLEVTAGGGGSFMSRGVAWSTPKPGKRSEI